MVWRRLLVCSDITIADLHYTLQIAFGWSDSHLHCFRIHGAEHGVHHVGGPFFDSDAAKMRLANFGFRRREWFLYEYDFNDHWVHEIRIEEILAVDPKRIYPVCVAGRRSAPPEDCGGVSVFMESRRQAPWRAQRLLDEIAECVRRNDAETLRDYIEQIPAHHRWLTLDQFDRRRVNRRLLQYATGDREWLFAQQLG
jgi:hypothetical protein